MPKHIVVVGGGIIGLCCAYSLRRRGCEVTVFEAGRLGGAASFGNAGWITPSLSGPVPAPGIVRQSIKWMFDSRSPLYVQPRINARFVAWLIRFWRHCQPASFRNGLLATAELNAHTFQLFDDLVQNGVTFEQHRKGLLFVFRSKDEFHRDLEILDLLRPFGYSPEALDPSEAQTIEPAVHDDVAGGIWVSQERQVRPDDLVSALGRQLLKEGAELREGVTVEAIETAAGKVKGLRVRGSVIPADAVVIATGVWMPRLLRDLKIRIPIEPGKGYSIDFISPPIDIAHALYLYEARVAVTPLNGRIRLAGTMEFSGMNNRIRDRRVEAIVAAAPRYLKNWPAGCDREQPWTGMRPMTPDGLPVIGNAPRFENLFLAGGHGMLGVTLGPATGEELAELIVSGREAPVLAAFDPARFIRRGRRSRARAC